MIVHLIRHAPALKADSPSCPPDPLRPLTAQGRSKMLSAAKGLAAMGVAPSVVLTSPRLRAIQTAEIIAAALDLPVSILRQTDALEPGAGPDLILVDLRLASGEALLVGHEPGLSALAAHWLGGVRPPLQLEFRKDACCTIDLELSPSGRPAGTLVALLQPRHLRKLRK